MEYKRSCLEERTDIVLWQTWVMIENYCAIHDLPLSTKAKANGFDGLDTELTINNSMVVKHMERLKTWMNDKRWGFTVGTQRSSQKWGRE